MIESCWVRQHHLQLTWYPLKLDAGVKRSYNSYQHQGWQLQAKRPKRINSKNERLCVPMKYMHIAIALSAWSLAACSANNARYQAEMLKIEKETKDYMEKSKDLINKHSSCLEKESQNKRLDRLELETAAYAIVATCHPINQEYKMLSRRFFSSTWMYESLMKGEEQKTLEAAKMFIALRRANR